jgi:5-methyltetrahydrofolate--homocysteine methyltransferase
MRETLIEAIVGMKETEALATADEWLGRGVDPLVVLDACSRAMEIVGERFEAGEYFLPELMMAGEILRQISDRVKPSLGRPVEIARRGTVVIGTVKGDIHDIGKDLVVFMLEVNGFRVIDLGIDVAPERFVDAIREWQPQVVGLSGFLSLAFGSMKETIDAIAIANLRYRVKIMIGGGQVDEEVRRYAGADEYGLNAMDAVNLSKGWTGGH